MLMRNCLALRWRMCPYIYYSSSATACCVISMLQLLCSAHHAWQVSAFSFSAYLKPHSSHWYRILSRRFTGVTIKKITYTNNSLLEYTDLCQDKQKWITKPRLLRRAGVIRKVVALFSWENFIRWSDGEELPTPRQMRVSMRSPFWNW